MCLSLNSCGVHGEARPHGAAPGEPINYRAVTPGRPGPVIDASCVAGEALSHAAKGQGHPADRPRWVVPGGMMVELLGCCCINVSHNNCNTHNYYHYYHQLYLFNCQQKLVQYALERSIIV